MKNQRFARKDMFRMAELAILTAIVLVFQLAGIAVRLPFLTTPVSLVLIPIVLGAVLLGPRAGAWLGFVFGAEVVIVCGVMATDPFTATLFAEHPVLTTLLCVGKGVAAGVLPAFLYRALREKSEWGALLLAAAAAPIANTGVFILGAYTMMDTFEANFLGGMNMFYFLVIVCAGVNFLVELALNIIFAPALRRVIDAVGTRLGNRTHTKN